MTTLIERLSLPVVGIVGQRDPDAVCEYFDDRPRTWQDQPPHCWSDGHYLCKECKWFDSEGRAMVNGDQS